MRHVRPVTVPAGLDVGPTAATLAWLEPLRIVVVGSGFFMVLVDTTVLNVALPGIGRALGGSIEGLQWVVDAYALVFAGLLLTGGALGDRFGARRVFRTGVGLFALSSAACGAAPSLAPLVAGRALQGVGAALLLPASLALLAQAFPEPRRRVRAVGAWSGIGAVALVAGPTLGGLAAATVGWRVVFWLNLPVAAAAFVLAEVLLPETAPKERGLDPAGQALAIVTLTALAGSLIEAGRLGWLSPPVLGGLLLAAAAATLFVAVERRVAEPMVPPDLLRRSGLVAPVVVGMLYNFAFYGVQFVASLYLQNARGASPAEVGLLFLPLTVTCAAFAFAAGPVAARCGPKVPMAAGMAVAALGALSMAELGPAGTALAAGGALVGLGGGLLSGPMTACVLASAPRERAGTASGLLNAARQAGGVLGIAVLGSVLGPTGAGEGSSRAALGIVAAAFATAALLALAFIRHDATAHAGT